MIIERREQVALGWRGKELAKAVCITSGKKTSAIIDKQMQIKRSICRFDTLPELNCSSRLDKERRSSNTVTIEIGNRDGD